MKSLEAKVTRRTYHTKTTTTKKRLVSSIINLIMNALKTKAYVHHRNESTFQLKALKRKARVLFPSLMKGLQKGTDTHPSFKL